LREESAVLVASHELEMVQLDAGSVVTLMVNLEPVGDFLPLACKKEVQDVGLPFSAPVPLAPITGSIPMLLLVLQAGCFYSLNFRNGPLSGLCRETESRVSGSSSFSYLLSGCRT
jgi:hypothetical protein